MDLKISTMSQNSVLEIYSIRKQIDPRPAYQRNGDLWNLDKRQLFIDSLISGYDVPKLYLHHLTKKQNESKENKNTYAIIDGQQRLETMWNFIDNKFPLGSLEFKNNGKVIILSNLYYYQLVSDFPTFAYNFDGYKLPIVVIQTPNDELDLVIDMFSRLNDAVSINAPEKRNAIGGKLIKIVRKMTSHIFFEKMISVSNKRYQHHEISIRLLFIESCINNKKIIDTKKSFLDRFAKQFKDFDIDSQIPQKVNSVLQHMCKVFEPNDDLLKSQARIPIYYLLFREAGNQILLDNITRDQILKFKKAIEKNRNAVIKNSKKENTDFSEYDRLTIQGTNDASSIKTRFRTMANYFKIESSDIYKL